MHGYLISYSLMLIVLAGLSGSAFAAVEIANSNIFGYEFFCMGLTERHLKAFNTRRLWSTIMWENFPQLIIQVCYTLWWYESIDGQFFFKFVLARDCRCGCAASR